MNLRIALLFFLLTDICLHAFDCKKIDEYMQGHTTFSGAILVSHGDKVIFKKGFGYANYEFQVHNDHATRFPIASNTKSFTAVAIMQLQERSMLSVHDKINTYISGFPDTITIHHLLTHTSGIPNYYKHWDSIGNCQSLEQMVDAIKSWNLEFKPGSRYSYSNTGYLLLAAIIEKISGKSFNAFLKEHIFTPLHMSNSGTISDGYVIKNKASGYRVINGVLQNTPSINNPMALLGNGDLYASVDDMFAWIQALFSEKILNAKSLGVLLDAHIVMEGSSNRYHAYGWFIDSIKGKKIAEYSGALVGYLSKAIRFVDDGITVIILSNREDPDQFFRICDELVVIATSQ